MAAVSLSVVLVCLTKGIHHEAMQLASCMPKLELKHPRDAALLVVLHRHGARPEARRRRWR